MSDITETQDYFLERIADLERQIREYAKRANDYESLARDRGAEIEAMRPTLEELKSRHDQHNRCPERWEVSPCVCSCQTCQMWRDYEARKPK